MSLQPGEDIGSEVHPDNEQVLICLDGSGKAVLNGEEMPFNKGDLVVVIAGTEHNFINTGASSMKVITIYSPPDHPAGTINKTKADAQAEES
jgi:mannose-6-phosphate isomerase-like protein (cupin superfamily)